MLALETYGLSKRYKDRFAVKDVSMHVEQGDIYGFVGENGAGKTTVIRLVTGLASPTKGGYAIYGAKNKTREIREAKKRTGAIVEEASLNRALTALENLRVQCYVTGAQKTDAELIALIKRVGLDYDAIKDRKVKNFSLGMRQRLGIAVVLVSEADFIILDEPMNGLDPQGFVEVRETIMKLRDEGVTFLISSHILSELEKVCTKVGIISHGKLVEEISMEDLRNRSRRRVLLTAENPAELKEKLVDLLGLQDVAEEGNTLAVYDPVDINDFMKALVDNAIRIDSISVHEETIEDHYIKLIRKGAES